MVSMTDVCNAHPGAFLSVGLSVVQAGGMLLLQGVQVLPAGSSFLLGCLHSLLPFPSICQLTRHGAEGHLAVPQLAAAPR